MRWQPTKGRRFSSLVLAPARIVVGVGAGMAVVAGFMPWAEGTAPGHAGWEAVFFSGVGGAGDGVVLVIVSALAGIATLHRTPATSRARSVRLAPAVLVLLAVMTWLNGYRAAMVEIAGWERRGGSGGIAPGLWLAAAGIALMAAGSIVLLPEVIRWQHHSDDPADNVKVRPSDVAMVVAGVAGAFAGMAAGIALALAITGPMIVGAIALGAVFGGLLGAYAGAAITRRLIDLLRNPDRGA